MPTNPPSLPPLPFQLTHPSPFMLSDLRTNLQRISGSLPPDDWDPSSPTIYLHREDSGILSVRENTDNDNATCTQDPDFRENERCARREIERREEVIIPSKKKSWKRMFSVRRRNAIGDGAEETCSERRLSVWHRVKRRIGRCFGVGESGAYDWMRVRERGSQRPLLGGQ